MKSLFNIRPSPLAGVSLPRARCFQHVPLVATRAVIGSLDDDIDPAALLGVKAADEPNPTSGQIAGGIIRAPKPAKISPRGPPRDKLEKGGKPRPRGYDKTQAGLPPPPPGPAGVKSTFAPRPGGDFKRPGGAPGGGGGAKPWENKPAFKKGGAKDSRGSSGAKGGQNQARKPKVEETRRTTKESLRARAERRRKEREIARAGGGLGKQEEIIEVSAVGMSVQELAQKLALPPADIVKTLFLKGVMVAINQTLDRPTVRAVCEAKGVEVWDAEEAEAKKGKKDDFLSAEDRENLVPRPPVVTVMGHVDHGKTSLLDFIRKTRVADKEAGGITQRIGAYNVPVADLGVEGAAESICFFDTPGHEAFSAMRARGAKVTDIAIIIVAADDGVRPQTLEAISHAKAAEVPIIVAINKIDKDGANVELVKQQLSNDAGLVPEEWGGDTPMVPISAKKGAGVNELLENVLLMAELLELQSNPARAARGTVIEAGLDRNRGPITTVLVQAGTLKVGDVVQVGGAFGRIRQMLDDRGKPVESAGPSSAVQMFGLNNVPSAGQIFSVFSSDTEARLKAEDHAALDRTARLAEQSSASMVSLSSIDFEDGQQRLNLVLKADAAGSLEAIKAALAGLPQDRVMVRFLMAAAGDITESDINLAAAAEAAVIGFNLSPSETVQAAAKRLGVDIRTYRVIYDLIDDTRAAMEGRLAPVDDRVFMGKAEVKAVFGGGNTGKVAGCVVVDGKLVVGNLALVKRGKKGKIVYEGRVNSLRRVKDNVKEVEAGKECGAGVEGFKDWEAGDTIEVFEVVRRQRTLEEAAGPGEREKNAERNNKQAVPA